MRRWLWVYTLALALALSTCAVCRAAEPLRLETKWLQVEVDPASGAIIGLAADPAGAGDFSHPLIRPSIGPGFGVILALRGADGGIVPARGAEGSTITAAANGITAADLRIGDSLSAQFQFGVAPNAPELTLRAVVRADAETPGQWAGALLALDPALAHSTIYFAGRQGLANISPGRITTPAAPYAGAVCKNGAERTFVFTCTPRAGIEIETAKERITIAIAPAIGQRTPEVAPAVPALGSPAPPGEVASPAAPPSQPSGPAEAAPTPPAAAPASGGEQAPPPPASAAESAEPAASPAAGAQQPAPEPAPPVLLHAGDTVRLEVRVVFGPPRLPALKPVTSKFLPLAQDFIFWTSLVATARPFGLPPAAADAAGSERWAQETAAVIAPASDAAAEKAYHRCWLRDVAHGWKSGMLVAGPDGLEVMRDELSLFAHMLDDTGQPPASIGPEGDATYGNLDSAGVLLGMIYDYLCRTGDVEFVRSLLPQADTMGDMIARMIGPHDLPVVGEGADTYPDLGLVKGEQTYLAVVCFDGLRKLGRTHEFLGDPQGGGKWQTLANRISVAANRTTDRDGLWDEQRGAYIGWRKPDGSLYRDEDSFANLLAMASGLCNDGNRVRAILARLNANWERYYEAGLCPTALSDQPYPNGLDQWAPWVGGWDVYIRTRFSEPRALEVWRLFRADYERTDFPYREASAYKQQDPNAGNRGRIWDSWGLLQAIYAGHYGIEMTPGHLRVLPRLLEIVPADAVLGLRWHDASYDITMRGRGLHLARVSVDDADWASCILPGAAGMHRVEITESAGARRAFVVDASPAVAITGAQHQEKGLHIEGTVPSAGRYWMIMQWPQEWLAMRIAEVADIEVPEVARLEGERAAIIFTVPRPGTFAVTLRASTLSLMP